MVDFSKNWTTDNCSYPLCDSEVKRYISVTPSDNQLRLADKPFYAFVHFGMNTSTSREWGTGLETVDDFKIKHIDAHQWVSVIKSSGASGIILTCKHHDGFCLWDSKYTDFCIRNTAFEGDIVKIVSSECARQNMDFGVYLSPWDMHEKTYGESEYNDYFCSQLTELLTGYGDIFEVWFDGAKGKEAKEFEYDWGRYYDLIHRLQPKANIAICGEDIRWVGNEGGRTRANEYCVVPKYLTVAESVAKNSQQNQNESEQMKRLTSKDEDLGSREVLKKESELCWYPAQVDVSIRKGWFHSPKGNKTVKSANKLFDLYLKSVGKNCILLLNVPPDKNGVIYSKDARSLNRLGEKIKRLTSSVVCEKSYGKLSLDNGFVDMDFQKEEKIKTVIIEEDIAYSQRVESFDLYLKTKSGYKLIHSGGVIGAKKIITDINKKCCGVRLVIRQSRSNPHIKLLGIYR